jgi:predicted metal-binding protein
VGGHGGKEYRMINQEKLEALFAQHGYTDFKWMKPKDIVVSQWVRMKCIFGCKNYGKNASCPPSVPSVAECRQFFDEYSTGAVLHFEKSVDKPEDRHAWSKRVNQKLLKLERLVFLAGYEKAFLLAMDSCGLCADCPGMREACKHPQAARPSPESMAVDVFATVRQFDYPIEILSTYSQGMNRYAFLLIE